MKTSSKPSSDSLSAALAESFKVSSGPPVGFEASAAVALFSPEGRAAAAAQEPARPKGVVKTTVSFHSVEQNQVDAILGLLLKSRRHRGGFSDAVKIALRLCPLEESRIGKAWDEARALDQRTKRGKKN